MTLCPIPTEVITDRLLLENMPKWRERFAARFDSTDLADRADTLAYMATSGHRDYCRGVRDHLMDALHSDVEGAVYFLDRAERYARRVLVDGLNDQHGGELAYLDNAIVEAAAKGADEAYIAQEAARLAVFVAIALRLEGTPAQ